MKTFITLAIVTALLAGSTASACDSLQGAWELSYAIYKDKDSKVVEEIKDGSVQAMKVLSQGHFSFITQGKDGKFIVAGAGAFSSVGNHYSEVVSYSSVATEIGKTYTFECQVKDGVWIQTGNENQLVVEERWIRAR
jgi:hypothetical protein